MKISLVVEEEKGKEKDKSEPEKKGERKNSLRELPKDFSTLRIVPENVDSVNGWSVK